MLWCLYPEVFEKMRIRGGVSQRLQAEKQATKSEKQKVKKRKRLMFERSSKIPAKCRASLGKAGYCYFCSN